MVLSPTAGEQANPMTYFATIATEGEDGQLTTRELVLTDEHWLAEKALLKARPHLFWPEVHEYLRHLHAMEIRQAMRRQDTERLAELAGWQARAEQTLRDMWAVKNDQQAGWMHADE